MPRAVPKTDRDALRMMKSLALVAGAWAFFHQVGQGDPRAAVWLLAGIAGASICWLLPRLVLPFGRPLYQALLVVGDLVSSVLLSALYLLIVWPWHGVLRLTGRIDPPEEPWPPPAESAWRSADAASSRVARRARPGSWAAALMMQSGAAVALLRFIYARPFAFVIPVLVLLLIFAAVILMGHSTGLGPLVYTLF